MKTTPYIIAGVLVTITLASFFISGEKKTAATFSLSQHPVAPFQGFAKASSAKINPAHGQPGHRCDIKAGAPLPDSQPQAIAKPSFPAAGNPGQTAAAAANTSTGIAPPSKAKVNPPHGQPGHRCDIKTGDPLPASGSAPAAKQVTPVKQDLPVAPVNVTPSSAANLNPAHGQPGHRCDIQVGAALPAS